MDSSVDDWDKHWCRFADFTKTNPAQEYRQRMILAAMPTQPQLRVLDIGSGQGDLAVAITQNRPDVFLVGLELSEEGVRVARRRVPSAEFHVVDLLTDDPPSEELLEWADVAVCSEVLEHLDDPATLLRHASNYFKPSCLLVVTVPSGPRSAHDRHIGHRRHYRRRELHQLLADAGFAVLWVQAAGFPFFNLYKLLVVARGSQFIKDVTSGEKGVSRQLRIAAWVFRILFHMNSNRAPWGWQLVAVARTPCQDAQDIQDIQDIMAPQPAGDRS